MAEKSHTGKDPPGNTNLYCQLIVAFVSLSYNLVIHQIDITSRHFAVSFSIPIHNIGIYFDKLYSIRCLLIVIGSVIEYVIYQLAGGDHYCDDTENKPEDKEKHGDSVRKQVGMTAFGLLLFVRIVFLILLYVSSQLSYHVYVVLSVEGFIYGFHDGALMGLASGYIPFVSLFYNVCRVFILLFQFGLDFIWYDNPLLMIKIQSWICVIFTAISVGLWVHFNIYLKSKVVSQRKKNLRNGSPNGNRYADTGPQAIGNGHRDTLDAVISPFVMFIGGSMFKDFLTPGTLPYALLQRDQCHMINMWIPVLYLIGPLSFLLFEHIGAFERWEPVYNGFLLYIIPMGIIFVYCFLSIHTQIQSARSLINSRPRVMAMTLMLVFFYGYLEPLNFIGVAKYAVRGNPYGYTIQGINNTVALLSRSFFARVSVGYTDTRISLGYILPKFRPNHRMSKKNLAWYIIRQTFKRAWKDLKSDLKLDIKKYL